MDEDFVTYEQAEMLRKLGFDWETYGYYDIKSKEIRGLPTDFADVTFDKHNHYGGTLATPTLAQAAKWLRNIKECYVRLFYLGMQKWNYGISPLPHETHCDISQSYYPTYEEALSAGLTEALTQKVKEAPAHRLKVKSCVQTCSACPSQWDIYTDEGNYIYVRYRWGGLTLILNNTETIFSKNCGGGFDGVISTEELKSHTQEILDWGECELIL